MCGPQAISRQFRGRSITRSWWHVVLTALLVAMSDWVSDPPKSLPAPAPVRHTEHGVPGRRRTRAILARLPGADSFLGQQWITMRHPFWGSLHGKRQPRHPRGLAVACTEPNPVPAGFQSQNLHHRPLA